jgi:MFS family permease
LCLPFAFGVLQIGKGIIIWSIVYTLIITLSEIFAMPFMMNYALSRPLKERQGQYSALYSIAFGIAIMAAPTLGLGIASKYGFDVMFYFFIVLSIMVAMGFSLLNRKS